MTTLRGYSPNAPLLLVTDYPASAGGGGAVILRSLLSPDDRDAIVWASLSPGGGQHRQEVALTRGSAALASIIGRRSSTIDALLAGRLADEILEVAQARRAKAIWIVMHGTAVHIAARLVSRKTLPIHLTVHDDPAFGVALNSRRYAAMTPLIERDFARALRNADSVDVISEGMAARYKRRYGVDSIVVHRGLDGPVSARARRADDGMLDVGVMGNTYGYGQLPLLANAVARVAKSAGRRPQVTVVGAGHGDRLRTEMDGRVEVEVTGHLDEPAAIERLSRCFALYLNYPFSWRAAVLRQTSFPTKLSSFVLAARPILAHAPTDSSIVDLRGMTGYVAWWGTESVSDGEAALRGLWGTPTAHESQHLAAEEVRRRHYDRTSNCRRLFAALEALVAA